MYHNMFSGSMWFGWLFWIILATVIISLVVATLNRFKAKAKIILKMIAQWTF